MKKEKKIFFEADDGLDIVLKKLELSSAEKVILNIPKNSVIGKEVENFHVLKQKAVISKKEITVESVDDHILECASIAQITAVNPVFRSTERAVSDIIMRPKSGKKIDEKIDKNKKDTEIEEDEEVIEEDYSEKVLLAINSGKREHRTLYERFAHKKEIKKRRGKAKKIISSTLAVVILAGIVFAALYLLPEARVSITLKRTTKQFNELIKITTEVSEWNLNSNGDITLPGQLLSSAKNAQIEVNAKGKTTVEEKARGILTIYNSYDKNPQTLVIKTRFESPDGKIFRITKEIKIPGMKSEGGKLVPSSIEAEVVADRAGDEYNIGPSIGWQIPGFKGTPRYNGFYAESKQKMTGGFKGERPSATEEDLKIAQDNLKDTLEGALNAQMSILLSDEFKLIDGATFFALTRQELQSDEARPDKALLYGEADMKKLVFIEEMFSGALLEKFKTDLPEDIKVKVDDLDVSYGNPGVDFINGKMEIAAEGSITFVSNISQDEIIENIKGKSENQLKEYIFSLPEVEHAVVSLWPFWVKSVPKNIERIDVIVK